MNKKQNNIMNLAEQLKAQENHNKLRETLMDYGCKEYGDSIIDDICIILNAPTTFDIADEFGELHPQSYYSK